jgi:hypothetical protein
MWRVLIDLARRERHWTLIGARMVELHAAERGHVMSRVTVDADALADARERPSPVGRLAQVLVSAGFHLDDPTAFGAAHTFVRDGVEIDVLAPEHIGERTDDALTTVAPAHTVQVPGGRQALARTEQVEVELGDLRGTIPRPNLLGAILIKARAVEVSAAKSAQRSDLALLLSFVDEPEALVGDLVGAEASWLRRRSELDSANADWWRGLTPAARQRGLSALRILRGG